MTEFHIGQRVRFRTVYRGYGNAATSIADELPDWLAEEVLAGRPMKITVEGYEFDQEEDTDVVIVQVQCGARRSFEQWVHTEAVEAI